MLLFALTYFLIACRLCTRQQFARHHLTSCANGDEVLRVTDLLPLRSLSCHFETRQYEDQEREV